MNVRSLGYRTDLFFVHELGHIEERDGYLIARTPSNPTYYFGNFLFYAHAPTPAMSPKWLEDFQAAFPECAHMAFGWDEPERGDPAVFLSDGFTVSNNLVLCASHVRAPHCPNDVVVVRPLESQDDWNAALECQIRAREIGTSEAAWRRFKTAQFANYRTLVERGRGLWFGAFWDGRVVGDLGLFLQGAVARYQQVGVDGEFRRRGIGSTLVYEAARWMAHHHVVHTFVIVAETGQPAAELYRSLDFRTAAQQYSLWKSV